MTCHDINECDKRGFILKLNTHDNDTGKGRRPVKDEMGPDDVRVLGLFGSQGGEWKLQSQNVQ